MKKPGENLPLAMQAVLVLTLIFCIPILAPGAEVTVNCPGQSIDAAISGLSEATNTIIVKGTCNEQVHVNFQNRLTIQSVSNATITWTGGGPVIQISDSHAIVLQGLLITSGAGHGVQIMGSEVKVQDSTIEHNGGNGINAMPGSRITVLNSTLSNNQRGIRADSSYLELQGGVIITNNRFHGVSYNLSTAKFNGVTQENIISSNGITDPNLTGLGVQAGFGSKSEFTGQNTLKDNQAGMQVIASSYASLSGYYNEDGSTTTTTITGGAYGINCAGSSMVMLSGPITISNTTGAGIQLTQNASLGLYQGPVISNNKGPGILADGNASIDAYGINISGNTAEGIRLNHLSTAQLWRDAPNDILNVFSGNGVAAIACDDSSIPYGDLTGIKPIKCTNYQPAKPIK